MAADFTSITERQREILRFVYSQHSQRTSFGAVPYNGEANAVNKEAVRTGNLIDSMIPKAPGVNGNVGYTQAEIDDLVSKGYLAAGTGENGGATYSMTNDGRLTLGQLGDRHPY